MFNTIKHIVCTSQILFILNSSDNHYYLFDFSIPVDNKPLQAISFTSAGYPYASIMAVSAMKPSSDVQEIVAHSSPLSRPTIIYNMNGMRIHEMLRGLNIIRMPDGTTKKVIKK